jgi:hypothetical protein
MLLGDGNSNGRTSVAPLWIYLTAIAGVLLWISRLDPVVEACPLLGVGGTPCALLQGPMVAKRALDAVLGASSSVTALRRSLAVDLLLIVLYTVLLIEACAWGTRGFHFSWMRVIGRRLYVVVLVAAICDLLENLMVASYVGGVVGLELPGGWEPAAASYLAWTKWVLLGIASLYATVVLLVATGRVALGWAAGPAPDEPEQNPTEQELELNPPGRVEELDEGQRLQREYTGPDGELWDGSDRIGIGLSGGGVRSASFNLGVLQALDTALDTGGKSWLRKADYLATVSGGGYVGLALQLLIRSAGLHGKDPQTLNPRPYAADAPETIRLGKHHRYLSDTAGERLRLIVVLVTGIAMNLAVLGVGLFWLGILASWLPDRVNQNLQAVPWWLGMVLLVVSLVASAIIPPSSPVLWRWMVWGAGVAGGLVLLPQWPTDWIWPGNWPLEVRQRVVLLSFGALIGWLLVPRFVQRRVAVLMQYVIARLSLLGVNTLGGHVARLVPGMLLVLVAYTVLVAFARGVPTVSLSLKVIVTIAGLMFWVFVDQRVWSPHRFYKRRLASAFAVRRSVDNRAEPIDYYSTITKLEPWAEQQEGFPRLVVCAAANLSNLELAPSGIPAVPFTFEHDYVGGPDLGWLKTKTMADILGARNREDTTLQAATAISGAAVASAMGSARLETNYAWIAVLNARLGVWLPNPRAVTTWESTLRSGFQRRWHRVRRATFLLREVFGSYPKDSRYVYVSDGGHIDNLGLLELLRRRCGTILLFDASGDPLGTISTLLGTIDLAASYLGIQITLEPNTESVGEGPDSRECVLNRRPPEPAGDSRSLWNLFKQDRLVEGEVLTARIQYPKVGSLEECCGRLVVGKAVLTPNTPPHILDWAAGRRRGAGKFPKTSTANQWLTDDLFKNYVDLGRFIGERVVEQAGNAEGGSSTHHGVRPPAEGS